MIFFDKSLTSGLGEAYGPIRTRRNISGEAIIKDAAAGYHEMRG